MMVPQPAPGRDCGACTACCTDLLIDDPQMHKPDGVRCSNLADGASCNACVIYETRPHTCRTWHCGWRLLTSLSDAMRPDLSRVMLVPEIGQTDGYRKGGLMFVPVGGDTSGMVLDEFVDLVGKCVAAAVPIYLSYGVGEACRRLLANPLLEAAVRAGDRADFVRRMHQLVAEMVTEVDGQARPATIRRWDSGPVAIKPGGTPA